MMNFSYEQFTQLGFIFSIPALLLSIFMLIGRTGRINLSLYSMLFFCSILGIWHFYKSNNTIFFVIDATLLGLLLIANAACWFFMDKRIK